MEIQEERISNTPWQILCSPEQKRSFQKFGNATGLNAQEAVARAFDALIERLQSTMHSQIIIALEKQKQCDAEKLILEKEKSKKQDFYDETFSKIKSDFELEKINLKKVYEEKVKNIQDQGKVQIKSKELKFTQLFEEYEKLESNFQRLERDKNTLQKQYTESMRSYEIADERLMEFRLKAKDLEEKLKNFESIKEKIMLLEKEEAFKREYLEKDLKREFAMKLMRINDGNINTHI